MLLNMLPSSSAAEAHKDIMPVRVHRYQGVFDLLQLLQSRKQSNPLQQAMDYMDEQGCGIVIVINGEVMASLQDMWVGTDAQAETPRDLREYGIGAQILRDLGVTNMLLLSKTKPVLHALAGYGLKVVGYHDMETA